MKITRLKKEQINRELLKDFIKLNNSYSPFLGPLDGIDQLKKLLNMSLYTLAVIDQNVIKGFCVVFKENSEYESENYKYFNMKHKEFLYIDRIGISGDLRQKGIGTSMYNYIFNNNKDNVPVCAEVNSIPLNEASISFHLRLGFKDIHKKRLNDEYELTYFEKQK